MVEYLRKTSYVCLYWPGLLHLFEIDEDALGETFEEGFDGHHRVSFFCPLLTINSPHTAVNLYQVK